MVLYSLAGNSGERCQKGSIMLHHWTKAFKNRAKPGAGLLSLLFANLPTPRFAKNKYPSYKQQMFQISKSVPDPHTCKSGCSILAERAKPHRPDQSCRYGSCLRYLESLIFIFEAIYSIAIWLPHPYNSPISLCFSSFKIVPNLRGEEPPPGNLSCMFGIMRCLGHLNTLRSTLGNNLGSNLPCSTFKLSTCTPEVFKIATNNDPLENVPPFKYG